METVQFKGETNWDAIVNHNGLDIEEEAAFEQYVQKEGYSKNDSLKVLTRLYAVFFEMDSVLEIDEF